jgi:hypothetical protein
MSAKLHPFFHTSKLFTKIRRFSSFHNPSSSQVVRQNAFLFPREKKFAPQLGKYFSITMQQKKHLSKLPTAIHPFAVGKTMLCRRLFKLMP